MQEKTKILFFILFLFSILFCFGCSDKPSVSADILHGQWQWYGADTGRNQPEVKLPITFTFLPDGRYICRITESTVEESEGTWKLDGNNVAITDTQGNTTVFVYKEYNGHTLQHQASDKEFAPRGITMILKKE